ncbi:MAG: hypothetical protein QOD06_715 [Candidatus Binatota bacterium]|jgi:molybdopterin-guanine dinucleotide biosynthesis protein A|nr:hypothetical protein [Candidatus Binatota bacterium]
MSGQNKALLEVGGVACIERVRRAAAIAEETRIVGGEPDSYAFLGCRIVPDRRPGLGPIAGLHAALADCETEWLLLLGCDLPFLTTEALARITGSREDAAGVVVPRDHEGRLQTVCALYPRSALREVERAIEQGQLALRDLVARIGVKVLAFDSFADLPEPHRLFFAVNDAESLAEARRVAAAREAAT